MRFVSIRDSTCEVKSAESGRAFPRREPEPHVTGSRLGEPSARGRLVFVALPPWRWMRWRAYDAKSGEGTRVSISIAFLYHQTTILHRRIPPVAVLSLDS